MANSEHVAVLREGVEAWNSWRDSAPNVTPIDLRGAKLDGLNLSEANLSSVELREADLSYSLLIRAKLDGASLSRANLYATNLSESTLFRTDLHNTFLNLTVFCGIDLRDTLRLDSCVHRGPSVIDHRTLQLSGRLPLSFLRSCGLPDRFIDYLPSLFNEPIQFYSCFISFSSKNQDFADRLHADLQNNGIRCWFAPHDLPIGCKLWDEIDTAIQYRDKLLLIMSEHSILSEWVEDEVGKAFAEERRRKQNVLFPIRIDDAVMVTGEPWAAKLRDQRHIGDFSRWNDPNAYQKALMRIMRDLRSRV